MIYKILISVFTFFTLVSGQGCPPEDIMLPCRCNFTFVLRCEYIKTEFNIKEYFERVAPLFPEDTVFEALYLISTNLTEIPPEATQSLKFKFIFIDDTPTLKYVAPDAFKGSENVTETLNIRGTQINNTVFDLINSFPKLDTLIMAENLLESIPSEAFGALKNLKHILIGDSNIANIGSRAFSKLTALRRFECFRCNIFAENWGPDSFEGVQPTFNLDFSQIINWAFLNETYWKPVLDNVGKLVIGGDYDCGFGGCRKREYFCDERADWICNRGVDYIGKISGFYCVGGNGVTRLSHYCLTKQF